MPRNNQNPKSDNQQPLEPEDPKGPPIIEDEDEDDDADLPAVDDESEPVSRVVNDEDEEEIADDDLEDVDEDDLRDMEGPDA